ncbi:unnamed protein product [Peronospora belbahrii]|uniref:Integrase catalytic domain-containing protein n=1 Tax=Peronospora belbahrii TaxID=622444 RepID=A0AAU9L4Q0_9STRA|nr:unnamed protein product [Peronospora belbahrii]CAH0517098.1 unnamed protein product [Peronospora belbahrii]
MVHLAPVSASIAAEETAALYIDTVFRHHGIPTTIVSDQDIRLSMVEQSGFIVCWRGLRSYATPYTTWSAFLPMTELAPNNAVHASTDLTSFYVKSARHPLN